MTAFRRWLNDESFFWQRVFIAALFLRLIPVFLARGLGIGLDDMFQYDMLARSIVSGLGFRWYAQPDLDLIRQYIAIDASTAAYDPRGVLTAFRAPLYPAFLALVYFFSGVGFERFLAARVVQAVLSAGMAPLTYFVTRQAFPANRRAARLAAWAVALYPMLVIYPLSLATENLFFVLVLAAAFMLLHAAEKPTLLNFILSGVLLGLAALTRSVILVTGGLAVLWVWFALRQRRGAVVMALALALTIAPWMSRNYVLFGRATIELSMGYNLYVGYHPESTGTFKYGPSLDLLTILDDGERERVGIQRAVAFIRADPARVPVLAVQRLGHFFGLERRALTYFYSNNFFGYIPFPLLLTAALVLLLPFVMISTSAALGLALMDWRKETLLLVLFVFAYLAPHVPLLAEDRFHLTLVPFLTILAAQAWTGGPAALWQRWQQSRWGKVALLLAVLVIFLLFTNWGLELHRDADKIRLLFGPEGNKTYFPY